MPGTLVAKCPSTITRPRLSFFTPASSRPSPSVKGTRPMATSTTSASMVSRRAAGRRLDRGFQLLAGGIDAGDLRRQLERDALLFEQALEALARHRGRCRARCGRGIRPPSPARRAAATPSRARARSRRRRPRAGLSGTLPSASAPVDDTMRFSSISMPLSRVTSEPVAMTMFLVSSVCALPSAPLTSTLPGPAMRPTPRTASTLFFLSRKSTPLTLPSTPSSLNFIIAPRSSDGLPTLMPIFGERVPGLLEQLGRMQQRLRRDAADIQAGAAEGLVLLHHRGLQAELRRADRADIAAGAGADDHKVVARIGHRIHYLHRHVCRLSSRAQWSGDIARSKEGRQSSDDAAQPYIGIGCCRSLARDRAGRCRGQCAAQSRTSLGCRIADAYGKAFDAWVAKHRPTTAIAAVRRQRRRPCSSRVTTPIRTRRR